VLLASRNMSVIKKLKKTTIHIVENHNEVIPFLYRGMGSKYLPLYNNVLIHFDSHPDLLIPNGMPSETVFDKYSLFAALSIENWILPAAYAGHISTIVWLKPPWANQISNGDYTFFIGQESCTNEIRVTCTENYFLSDALFAAESELNNKKEISLIVRTIDAEIDRTHLLDIGNMLLGILENQDIFILDIDLDFFSTRNPFGTMYRNCNLYERLKKLYRFEEPSNKNSIDCIQRSIQRRRSQLSELEDLFKYLDKHNSLDNYLSDHCSTFLEDVRNIVDEVKKNYTDADIDWLLIHDMGCTCDDSGLPDHVNERTEIEKYISLFANLLELLPSSPVFITISRSSEDDYCPLEDVDYIQDLILTRLLHHYTDVNVEHEYLRESEDTE